MGTQGEVPVFPIQIFKIKDGVSYSEADYQKAMADFETALNGGMSFEAPNFDLFLQACRTTAKALFPNFMFLDTPFNQNEKWDKDDPKRYRYELATMGCRTRVFENLNGEKTDLFRAWEPFVYYDEPTSVGYRSTPGSGTHGGKRKSRNYRTTCQSTVH